MKIVSYLLLFAIICGGIVSLASCFRGCESSEHVELYKAEYFSCPTNEGFAVDGVYYDYSGLYLKPKENSRCNHAFVLIYPVNQSKRYTKVTKLLGTTFQSSLDDKKDDHNNILLRNFTANFLDNGKKVFRQRA